MKKALYLSIYLFILTSCSNNWQSNMEYSFERSNKEWIMAIEDLNHLTSSRQIDENETNIFYISGNKLYGIDKIGEHKANVLLNDDIQGFYLAGEYLYYINLDDTIYRMNIEGGKSKRIWDESKLNKCNNKFPEFIGVIDFFVNQDILYLQSTGISFLKYDISQDKTEPFSMDVSSYAFSDDSFYFTDHAQRTFSLYGQNLDTGEIELLRGDGKTFEESLPTPKLMIDEVVNIDENLYYATRVKGRVFLYNPNGDDKLIYDFSEEEGNYFLKLYSDNKKLYFSVNFGKNHKGNLYVYDPEKDMTTLLDIEKIDPNRGLSVVNDILFFYPEGNDTKLKNVSLKTKIDE